MALQAEDLYDLIPDETALHCERKWKEAMEEEKLNKKTKNNASPGDSFVSVWKLLYKSMGRKFMLGSIYKVFWLVAVVLQVARLFETIKIV